MNNQLIAIISIGVILFGQNAYQKNQIDNRIDNLAKIQTEQGNRLDRVEGMLQILIPSHAIAQKEANDSPPEKS
ncbi:MAG: hypothetical protein OXE97_00755 [Gammaproteobacteria bacterium]|nr:hypothetical protein [Gammaproteobacteria bacterium]MCY4209575.1 hypothetical protein [Gammaproteobacteria bacterium]MCY4282704.1 hypothetical protein [Gammaproteobacteria bacterium]